MPSKYQKISSNIQKITIDNPKTKADELSWLNIVNAGKKEIEYLRKKYDFNLSDLHAASAKIQAQRPSFTYNKDEDYIFLILHFPIFINGHIVAGEIDFFIKKGLLITVHNDNIPGLTDFFNYAKKDGVSLVSYKFESAAVLLYEILKKLILKSYNLLDQNSVEIAGTEETIFSYNQKNAVSRILTLRRNIINFRKIMQNHKDILKKIMKKRKSSLVPPELMKEYYGELIEYSKTIWEILENQKEMIEVLNDTNESLLNNRLSEIIKTLTIFSVIVLPLNLLAGIFGMNPIKAMPFIESSHGFWYIIIIMVCGSLGMLYFFEKKKWL